MAATKQTGLQGLQGGSNGRVAKSAVHPRESLGQRRIHENYVRS